MLNLTIKNGDYFTMEFGDVVAKVYVELKSGKIKVGVDAPLDVRVLRSGLERRPHKDRVK